jgi:hypothetical protein
VSGAICENVLAVLKTAAMSRSSTLGFSVAPQGLRPRARLLDQPAGSTYAYWYWRFS